MKNYFSRIMSDGYDILLSEGFVWPTELEDDQKIHLMNLGIEYFCELEEYMKCAQLQKKIDVIVNPPKRRGRPRKQVNIN